MIVILRRDYLGSVSCPGVKNLSRYNDDIQVKTTGDVLPDKVDLLIRWGTTASGPKAKTTLNKSSAIAISAKKGLTRHILKEKGISVPKLFHNHRDIEYPVIVRPERHSQGSYLYHCINKEELDLAIEDLRGRNITEFYISKYIKKAREYGVYFFDGKITSVMEKVVENKNAIAWNFHAGGCTFKYVKWNEWPLRACDLAIKTVKAIGLDFGRIDIIEDEDGQFYVLESNSGHSLTSPYEQQCFVKALDHFIEKGRLPASKFKGYKTYNFFIHPAIKNKTKKDEAE